MNEVVSAWIPIEENIYPEDDWEVLVSGETYDGEPIVCFGKYHSELDLWETDDDSCRCVCAWMGKPDSYKRNGNNK